MNIAQELDKIASTRRQYPELGELLAKRTELPNYSGEIDFKSITPRQHAWVMREALKDGYRINKTILDSVGRTKLNKTKYTKLAQTSAVRFSGLKQVVNLFYRNTNVTLYNYRVISDSILGRPVFISLCSRLLHDACGLGSRSLLSKYRTSDVMAMVRGMRATLDTSSMPIFADALEDAGFGESVPERELLNHYRDPQALFSVGSWIFRATGVI